MPAKPTARPEETPKTRKRPKSSLAARKLIRAALKRHGTLRAAAKALRLPTHGQLQKMLSGEIRDTPAMKAALARARARARRAFYLVREEGSAHGDVAHVCQVIHQVRDQLATLEALVKCSQPDLPA